MLQSVCMAKKREFEAWELQDAKRLKLLINRHLEKNKITQAEFAAQCGWTQGMIYQYTSPERALGLENVAIFAGALDVSIDAISPTLAKKIRDLHEMVEHQIIRKSVSN